MIDATGAYRYYTADRVGSIRADTGPAGGVRDRGSYMPFGEALANGGGGVTNDGNPLAFTGQYLDPVTGLYDMRARSYDSSLGRFASSDPLAYLDAPRASTYAYARNNPLSFVDPSGMGAIGNANGSIEDYCFSSWWSTSLCAGIAVTGTVAAVGTGSMAIDALGPAGEGAGESGEEGATDAGGGVLRHYTTSEAADAIQAAGRIEPSPVSGNIYLTPDEYASGSEAEAQLAMDKTPDGCFEIPMCRATNPSAPSSVEPANGQPGGGTEITTTSPIDISDLPFVRFGD